LREKRQKLLFVRVIKKGRLDKEIARVDGEIERSQEFFEHEYGVESNKAHKKTAEIRKEIRFREKRISAISSRIAELSKYREFIAVEYRKQKRFIDDRPDKEQICHLAELLKKSPDSAREKRLSDECRVRLEFIPEKIIVKTKDKIASMKKEQEQEKRPTEPYDRGR
jgi:protein tyrosine phosphatase (PTP) superfamily phosphohydrolase (DUF442 family)